MKVKNSNFLVTLGGAMGTWGVDNSMVNTHFTRRLKELLEAKFPGIGVIVDDTQRKNTILFKCKYDPDKSQHIANYMIEMYTFIPKQHRGEPVVIEETKPAVEPTPKVKKAKALDETLVKEFAAYYQSMVGKIPLPYDKVFWVKRTETGSYCGQKNVSELVARIRFKASGGEATVYFTGPVSGLQCGCHTAKGNGVYWNGAINAWVEHYPDEYMQANSKKTKDGFVLFQDPKNPNNILWLQNGKWVETERLMGKRQAPWHQREKVEKYILNGVDLNFTPESTANCFHETYKELVERSNSFKAKLNKQPVSTAKNQRWVDALNEWSFEVADTRWNDARENFIETHLADLTPKQSEEFWSACEDTTYLSMFPDLTLKELKQIVVNPSPIEDLGSKEYAIPFEKTRCYCSNRRR